MRYRQVLTDPIIDNNPVTLQILGICSAVAVTRSMWPAFVMAISVTAVLMFSNTAVSALRGIMPRSVRLVLEVTLIASAVIVADEALQAYAPETSKTLSVFVGLIITNCIVLGRAESFALNNGVRASFLDGLGNGIGYGLLLLSVAAVRELFGSGTLMDQPVFAQTADSAIFVANEFMALPASAFFIIGLIIWALRSWKPDQVEAREFDAEDGG